MKSTKLPERIQEVIAMARASVESQYPAEYEWILFGSWATGKAAPIQTST